MSDSSGSSSYAHKSQLPSSVHKPASMATCKDVTTGKDWFSIRKDASGAIGIGSLGVGSAFAKYVRKEPASSSQHERQHAGEHMHTAPSSNTSSGEAETIAAESQPSTTTFNKLSLKQQQQQQEEEASQPDSSDRSDDDGIDDGDVTTSSSDSENGHTNGNGGSGKHSKKRFRSAEADSKSKKQRLIWTPELHARFLAAVNHLGVKNAVPKTILQLMNVEGMTRENVASHLQKYRLYLKRLAGLPANVPLSADTLQQVQTVQHALQQQVQAGFQTSHTLQLAAGGMPLSLAGIPAVSLAGNYQDLVNQLLAANAGSSASSASSSVAGPSGLTDLQASTLAALQQRSQLVGVLPGMLPIGFAPLSMAGFGGLNSALLGGATGSLGMQLANSGLLLQGSNVLAAQLNGGNGSQ